MNYEWAFVANWLIFSALTLLFVDPFDLFSSDDDDGDDTTDVVDETTIGISFIGENTDDDIDGTDGDDIFLGLAGDDQITGGAGDDYIEGNVGDDTITGDAGNDSIAGGGGLDQLFGGAGDDVISSDRLDSDAEWDRGGAETLSGGDGDDTLYFSGQDVATGGDGADSFNMVVDTEDGPAHITDFSAADERLTLYADYDTENPPEITTVADSETETTSIMLGDQATVTLDGVFERDDLDIELKTEDDLELDHSADL
jgi:Ca2+-binding RTX toxin-like protein